MVFSSTESGSGHSRKAANVLKQARRRGKTLKKLISLSSILLLFVLLLSACGSEAATPSNQPVTLRYAIWDKNQAPALQQMINAFKKTHPTVDVKLEVTPWADYWTKLETAATGGSTADVFWMNGPNLVKYASNRSEEHTSELQSQSNLVC